MYRITRHTRPSPSPDSSRLVLGSDNIANLKARVGFIILAVSLTYMHREYISSLYITIAETDNVSYKRIEDEEYST